MCLREVDIVLGPLTVLVGPNASGKSAFLDALNPQFNISEQVLWHHNMSNNAAVHLQLDGNVNAGWSLSHSPVPMTLSRNKTT
jgi:predicted ATP-dependent endonuclease of OLD family